MLELLNIVNDQDQIIGQETRKKIHEEGLLHREIHVYFTTPKGEIILQHRAKDKDTFPDLFDATVGGHVEIGESYEEAAIKEAKEETGMEIIVQDLIPVNKVEVNQKDNITGKVNHAFQSEYLYFYKGKVEDLKIEEGKALGFKAWPINKLENLNEEERKLFIPYVVEFLTTQLIKFINSKQI